MEQPLNSNPPVPTTQPNRRRFLTGILLGSMVAGLVGYAIGSTVPVADAALHAMSRHRPGFGHGHGPEQMREHAGFILSFALHRLDASAEQEEQIQAIADAALDEIEPLAEQHRESKEAIRALLTAETIDRAALEELRVTELALADAFSRAVVRSVGDAAEVLTLEQRTALAEHLGRFRHRR